MAQKGLLLAIDCFCLRLLARICCCLLLPDMSLACNRASSNQSGPGVLCECATVTLSVCADAGDGSPDNFA
jgi:hypothetical protein